MSPWRVISLCQPWAGSTSKALDTHLSGVDVWHIHVCRLANLWHQCQLRALLAGAVKGISVGAAGASGKRQPPSSFQQPTHTSQRSTLNVSRLAAVPRTWYLSCLPENALPTEPLGDWPGGHPGPHYSDTRPALPHLSPSLALMSRPWSSVFTLSPSFQPVGTGLIAGSTWYSSSWERSVVLALLRVCVCVWGGARQGVSVWNFQTLAGTAPCRCCQFGVHS